MTKPWLPRRGVQLGGHPAAPVGAHLQASGRLPVLLIAAALLLSGCGVSLGASKLPNASPSPSPSPQAAAVALANKFMKDFTAQRWTAQWSLLATQAQNQWPSESARTSMLAAKFGAISISGYGLGSPTSGATWTNRLNLSQVPGLWQIPVSVSFGNPSGLLPTGVAASFQDLALYVGQTGSKGSWQVVGEGPAGLEAPLIVPANPPAVTDHVPILMYHLIGSEPVRSQYTSQYGYAIDVGLTVQTPQFDQEMQYLSQNGYHTITLNYLGDSLYYSLPLPANPVIITFDDGRSNTWPNAVPTLRQYGLGATFFPLAALLGETNGPQSFLTSSQVAQLNQMGFSVQDHTMNDLVALWSPGLSTSQLKYLTVQSRADLQALTNTPIQWISYSGPWAYPSSSQAGPNQLHLFQELASFGYIGGLTADTDGFVETTAQIWQLPRIRVNNGESLSFFACLLQRGLPANC